MLRHEGTGDAVQKLSPVESEDDLAAPSDAQHAPSHAPSNKHTGPYGLVTRAMRSLNCCSRAMSTVSCPWLKLLTADSRRAAVHSFKYQASTLAASDEGQPTASVLQSTLESSGLQRGGIYECFQN